jgi:hypothetical protein
MAAKLSTTHFGTAFESHCSLLLRQSLGMSLNRIGGKGDGGVDLRGWWYLPRSGRSELSPTTRQGRGRIHIDIESTRSSQQDSRSTPIGRRLRVLAQCKAEKLKAGPRLIREMEGVARRGFDLINSAGREIVSNSSRNDANGIERIPSSANGQESLSQIPEEWRTTSSLDQLDPIKEINSLTTIICTRTGFSSSATTEALRSSVPMLLLHIPFEMQDAWKHIIWRDKGSEEPYPVSLQLRAALANPSLTGPSGVLGQELELRKEYDAGGQDFGMGLWWRDSD